MNFIKRWRNHTCDSIFVLIYISDTESGVFVQCEGVFSTLNDARKEMEKQFEYEKRLQEQEEYAELINEDMTGVYSDSACIRLFAGEYKWIIKKSQF